MNTEGTNLLLLTMSAFWSSSRWPLGGRYRQVSLYQSMVVAVMIQMHSPGKIDCSPSRYLFMRMATTQMAAECITIIFNVIRGKCIPILMLVFVTFLCFLLHGNYDINSVYHIIYPAVHEQFWTILNGKRQQTLYYRGIYIFVEAGLQITFIDILTWVGGL